MINENLSNFLKEYNVNSSSIFHNLSYEKILEHELKNKDGILSDKKVMMVDTGIFTGRSPKDKYIVEEDTSKEKIWWGNVNKKISEDIFNRLYKKCTDYLSTKPIYVYDGFAGADKKTTKGVRIITEKAWQHHFCKNMFIDPTENELKDFQVDFTILNACEIKNEDYKEDKLNSEVFIIFHLAKKVAIIGGTHYGGEMKKGIFSIMNYSLPLENILSMHCSANVGEKGDTALFFGLSGTGKTTLSTDKRRKLIGDDEHGWDDNGVFNIEGGCYAKVINLNKEHEPEIYDAIKTNALLENVVFDEVTKEVDYTSSKKTENTRVTYPLSHIENIQKPSIAGHPKTIIFLTYDAFGVLPPVSRLTPEQAMYHFLSGYTAKVAGTERGVKEPTATFSTCFGAAFLTLQPTCYAKLLGEKMKKHNTRAYLLNTGLVGGSYGVGKRMGIVETRTIINRILDGTIENADFHKHEVFQIEFPKVVEGVASDVLNPKESWENKEEYDKTAHKLASLFIENFHKYESDRDFDYSSYGPKI